VRGLLDRLAQGGITQAELKYADQELDRADAFGRLDPRRRVVELWRGSRTAPLDLPTLRMIQASLRGASQWIVQVKPTR
jgi:hypothetical protein